MACGLLWQLCRWFMAYSLPVTALEQRFFCSPFQASVSRAAVCRWMKSKACASLLKMVGCCAGGECGAGLWRGDFSRVGLHIAPKNRQNRC